MSKNKQPSVPLVRSGQEFSNVDKEKKGSIIKFVGFRVSDILPSAFIHYL